MEYTIHNNTQPRGTTADTRRSVSSRISRVFDRRQDHAPSISTSHRTSGACEVPIFMATSSHRSRYAAEDADTTAAMSPPWRSTTEHDRHVTLPASSVYSQSPDFRAQDMFMDQIEEEETRPVSSYATDDLEVGTSSTSCATSEADLIKAKRRRRRRASESYKQKIGGKKRLGMAFGVTTLATVITYTVLAVTGVASGIMFHVSSLIFIMLLMGVFLHSAISLVMLQRRRRARLARQRDWYGSRGDSSSLSSSSGRSEGSVSEKPIEVIVGGDEVVSTTPRGNNKKVIRPPPPVYGNVRESKRISDDMLFWHKQNPSPNTPTYEEAMSQVQTAVGYSPPQYVSPQRHRQVPESGQRVSDIHPLERGRLAGLLGNTMSSQR